MSDERLRLREREAKSGCPDAARWLRERAPCEATRLRWAVLHQREMLDVSCLEEGGLAHELKAWWARPWPGLAAECARCGELVPIYEVEPEDTWYVALGAQGVYAVRAEEVVQVGDVVVARDGEPIGRALHSAKAGEVVQITLV